MRTVETKTYYVSWTYLGNYSSAPASIAVASPEAAAQIVIGFYSKEFGEKADLFVYEALPVHVLRKGVVDDRYVPAPDPKALARAVKQIRSNPQSSALIRDVADDLRVFFYSDSPFGWNRLVRLGVAHRIEGSDKGTLTAFGKAVYQAVITAP